MSEDEVFGAGEEEVERLFEEAEMAVEAAKINKKLAEAKKTDMTPLFRYCKRNK
eukprot:CAMPEP_0113944830 /NCGR_PEP_ID=MMETSP1339-20121228/37177_1 /TAXON_ID=94617 /ORGANISM="Fibrocapsa japonica" /LENGTH=53 /DNA_ID=CAMNT_0000950163 /DNA_START=304 /DNA_END=465 /DNA_ORIENTATION=- /assembly_acc=CAM_ASM_000762